MSIERYLLSEEKESGGLAQMDVRGSITFCLSLFCITYPYGHKTCFAPSFIETPYILSVYRLCALDIDAKSLAPIVSSCMLDDRHY